LLFRIPLYRRRQILSPAFSSLNVDNINSAKPYRLTFEHRPGYLYAYVEGEEDSYEISRAYWQDIADECREKKYKKALVVEDLVESGTIAEAYQLCSEMPQMGYIGIKVAFVDRYSEQSEENQFGELVAVNRGINVKIFTDTDDAEKWLLAG
jgi:hypothetical protein